VGLGLLDEWHDPSAVGAKELSPAFQGWENGILSPSPVGTTENTCGANGLPCLRHSEFLSLTTQR